MKTLKYFLFFAIVVMAGLTCSKDNDNSTTRTVTILLTDNPMDAEEVNVDIKSVRLKQGDDDNDDNDDDANWSSIDTKDTIYNLLSLQNDVNVLLASGPFPFDHLKEVRLVLGDNNTIKIDGKLYPMKVPSGSASGLKIKVDRDLSDGENEIIIDFDAALSVHETGDGKYMLRPVIRLK